MVYLPFVAIQVQDELNLRNGDKQRMPHLRTAGDIKHNSYAQLKVDIAVRLFSLSTVKMVQLWRLDLWL